MRNLLFVTMILSATNAFAWTAPTENAADCPLKKGLVGQGLIHDSPFIMQGTQTVVDAKVQTPGTTDSGPSARDQ